MKLVFIAGPYRADSPYGIVAKLCRGCDRMLPVEKFGLCSRDGLQSKCKECRGAQYQNNKASILAKNKDRYEKNKGTILARQKEYAKKNREKIAAQKKARWPAFYERDKEKILAYHKQYREKNQGVVRERIKKSMAKKPIHYRELQRKHDRLKRQDPKFRAGKSMSNAIRRSIKTKACRRWEVLAGYSLEQLCRHLERRFKPGMNWDNYGSKWHIDHIIPLAAHNYQSTNDPDFERAWALKNLQPLWAKENQIKNRKIDKPFQPSLSFGGSI